MIRTHKVCFLELVEGCLKLMKSLANDLVKLMML